MILLLTLFCGMLSAHNVLAQELKDYVITMKGDTIYGEMGSVKSKKVYMLVKGERKVYFPPQIYRIYNHNTGKHYATSFLGSGMEKIKKSNPEMFIISEKTKLKNKPLFKELLIDGEIMVINIYTSHDVASNFIHETEKASFWNDSEDFYAQKRLTGEITELKTRPSLEFEGMSKKKRRLNLVKMMEDEPELVDRFVNEEKLNFDLFCRYIKEYNAIKQDKNAYVLEIF